MGRKVHESMLKEVAHSQSLRMSMLVEEWVRAVYSPLQDDAYSLWGSNPRPMAHKTIALTTELRELQDRSGWVERPVVHRNRVARKQNGTYASYARLQMQVCPSG